MYRVVKLCRPDHKKRVRPEEGSSGRAYAMYDSALGGL